MSETTTPRLTSEAVTALLKGCLFRDDEIINGAPPEAHVRVDGIVNNYAFHPDRLQAVAPQIAALLAELPDEFQAGKGGGYTFLNMCMDRHGNHWAEHPTMEALCVLAIGTKQGIWLMPREMWGILPGGVPYFGVLQTAVEA